MDQNKSNCSHHHHHHHDHDHDHHHDGGNNETTFPQQNVGSLRCMRHDSATSFILVVYRCCLMSLCDGCLLPQANSPPCAPFGHDNDERYACYYGRRKKRAPKILKATIYIHTQDTITLSSWPILTKIHILSRGAFCWAKNLPLFFSSFFGGVGGWVFFGR